MSLSTSSVDEYKNDILLHMSNMQSSTWFDPNLIDLQPELQWHMRPYLLDFLIESHFGLELTPQTLFLAVNIIDRYSAKRIIYKRHYQLVGCTALWIASKYQDKKDRIPTLHELKVLCCGAYESHMFVQMESHILSTLEWTIGHPTCDLYIDINIDDITNKGYKYSAEDIEIIRNLALFACELSMFHKSLLVHSSATIATCAVALAHWIWSYSRYYNTPPYVCAGIAYHGPPPTGKDSTPTDTCFQLLCECIAYPSNCLQRKYSRSRYSRVFYHVLDFNQKAKDFTLNNTPPPPPPMLSNSGSSTPASIASSRSEDFPPSPVSINNTTTNSYRPDAPPPQQLPSIYATGLARKERIDHQHLYYHDHNSYSSGYITPPFTPEEGGYEYVA